MPTIILNGESFNSSIAGLEAVTANIRRSEGTGGAAFSFSGELTFYGRPYEIIKELILEAPVPHLVKIPIMIIGDECPNNPFIGFIEGANVDWCEINTNEAPCFAKAQIIDGSEVSDNLACIKNTLIWAKLPMKGTTSTSAGEETFRASRYITYCSELRPRALAEFIMIMWVILRTILTPVVFVIAIIVTIINAIIKAINTIPFAPNIQEIDFDGNDATGPFQEFKNLLDAANDLITGCGAKHKAPFLHSYLQNVCDVCGLTLNSSLLNVGGWYHNTMRLDATTYDTPPNASAARVERCYQNNKPNLNGGQLLDELRQNLNWEWWLEGNVLRIEAAGDIEGLVWFEQGDGTVIKKFCISTTDETVKAYGVYSYQQDAVDNTSNETIADWGAVVDWNTPPSPLQRGALQRNLIYSAALFRQDAKSDGFIPIDKDFYNNSFAFPNLSNFKNVLIMNKGLSSQPKLLVWDGSSPQNDAKVQRWGVGGGKFDYNTRFWLRASHPSGPTLYNTSFDKTDNPRLSAVALRKFTIEICLTCELLETAPMARLIKAVVQGQNKTGVIEEISINYGTMTATVSGKI